MFKLIKILNSGVNVSETVKIKKSASLSIKRGVAITIVDGYASLTAPTVKPEYITIADSPTGKSSVMCHPVMDNMLFETTVNAAPTSLTVGSKVTISANSDCVTATTASGVATVVELMDAKASGDKITVKF